MHNYFFQSSFLTQSYQRIHILDDLCKVLIQMSHRCSRTCTTCGSKVGQRVHLKASFQLCNCGTAFLNTNIDLFQLLKQFYDGTIYTKPTYFFLVDCSLQQEPQSCRYPDLEELTRHSILFENSAFLLSLKNKSWLYGCFV